MKLNLNNFYGNERITTALLLAAGTGSRLYPLTRNSPKCLTLVNEKSILERLVIGLKQQGFKRLVIVTGYQENCIREFLGIETEDMDIEYIFSPLYKTTNNIYSLWMAREIINEPFMLIESDLVFDESLLDNMCNIYSFSLSSWYAIVERLDQYISVGRVNNYYETVFAEMVSDGSLCFQVVSFDNKPWYEIDTIADLTEAEKLFPAEIYQTSISGNFILQTPEISDRFFQMTKSTEAKEVVG